MKSFANRFLMFTASVVAAGTLAYGQTPMKAEVPFAFTAQHTSLPAGTYQISIDHSQGGFSLIKFWNADTHRTVMTLPASTDSGRSFHDPSLMFQCGDSGCSLSAVRFPAQAYDYPASKQSAHERTTSIALRSVNAD
jgi:hypothetical protein